MRVLVIDSYYEPFQRSLYAADPRLSEAPYDEQLRVLMAQCFGTADFYSRNLQRLGHEGAEIVANCGPLQERWAVEHGLEVPTGPSMVDRLVRLLPWRRNSWNNWWWRVVAAQIRSIRPDVLHIQDMCGTPAQLLAEVRPDVGIITGQIASEVLPGADFGEYDLVLSSFPHFVERFRREGLASEYFQLGFEPRVLDAIAPAGSSELAFVGGLSARHGARTAFLEDLADRFPLDWWGYGVEQLAAGSSLRGAYRGSAWGLSMYERLATARIAINVHIDTAAEYANNMRLYEATGVGSLLLTEEKRNLSQIFSIGTEVVAYRSVEHCAELIEHFLSAEEERASIARAGQARTLEAHTYLARMEEFLELVEPLVRSAQGRHSAGRTGGTGPPGPRTRVVAAPVDRPT